MKGLMKGLNPKGTLPGFPHRIIPAARTFLQLVGIGIIIPWFSGFVEVPGTKSVKKNCR